MLKSIFTQLWNRKRSNTWIALELLLVFCLIWYLTDYLFVLTYNYHIPNGRNTDHTWQLKLAEYPPEHPAYRPGENTGEALEANFARILQTIRNYPGVEAVSLSFNGSAPGLGSYWGTGVVNADDSTLSVQGQQIMIDAGEDFFHVFGYTTGNGKKAVSTRDFDWTNPNAAVVGRSVAEALFPGVSTVEQKIITIGWPKEYKVIAGVVDDIKRFDYERPQSAIYLPKRPDSTNIQNAEISIRSNASLPDVSFKEAFKKEMTNALQTGNFYLKSMIPYAKIEQDTSRLFGLTSNVQTRIYLMIFFLLNILLCVMGTFWYRINTRKEEIGIRKALGSSSIHIRNMLLTEGLCLLAIATLPAMLIEYQFVRADLIETLTGMGTSKTYLPDRTMLRFLITNGITWIIIAVVIVSAIWLPARKAAALQPADALHYE
jgi:hypothetical protein